MLLLLPDLAPLLHLHLPFRPGVFRFSPIYSPNTPYSVLVLIEGFLLRLIQLIIPTIDERLDVSCRKLCSSPIFP